MTCGKYNFLIKQSIALIVSVAVLHILAVYDRCPAYKYFLIGLSLLCDAHCVSGQKYEGARLCHFHCVLVSENQDGF